ncbi:MAG: precorrin-2 dehydrogenase/sirohydrochlorin ferrochelatase family protein [Fusobacteriaceae bacterium]
MNNEQLNNENFYPFFINMTDKKCLVIGAGNIALRKTNTLLELGAKVTVIAEEVLIDKFFSLPIILKIRKFSPEIITKEYFLVIAGTNNTIINDEIVSICFKQNILVNNISSKTDMDIRFSSIINNKDYQIGISGKGNPKKSIFIKEIIKKALKNINFNNFL